MFISLLRTTFFCLTDERRTNKNIFTHINIRRDGLDAQFNDYCLFILTNKFVQNRSYNIGDSLLCLKFNKQKMCCLVVDNRTF